MIVFIILLILLLIPIYLYTTRTFDYWKIRGVKYVKPIPIFGSLKENYLMRMSLTESYSSWYNSFPEEKVVGFFRSSLPGLIIRDPELVKRILITDFAHFYERGIHPDKYSIEPLLQNLFFVEGDLWRLLRQRMTPAFTSGKLKNMFPLIVDRAEQLQLRALTAARKGATVDARDLMARYTTDFIGACGFGLDAGSLNEEDSGFRKLGEEIFEFGKSDLIKMFLKYSFPAVTRRIKFFDKLEDRVYSIVNAIIKDRNGQASKRNDFVDLLMEAQRKGTMEVESMRDTNPDGTPKRVQLELTNELFAAQIFVFFAAGFETSSSATSFTLHKLAHNPEVQAKVQEEIDTVLMKYDNKLSYDAIKEMTYLDWTFKEGMRLFPSLGYLARVCTKNYEFSELNFSIDEGVFVIIPLQAMHTDPLYFDRPLEFWPDRFSPENSKDMNKFIYLPFGDGPRACIGARLGNMQSLAGLAAILSKFTVRPAPETVPIPPIEKKFDVVQSFEGGLPLLFIERKKVE